jgi:glycogen operon protein
LTVVLNGAALHERDRFGQPLQDSSFALFFNASEVTAECLVPGRTAHTRWRLVLDTAVWPPAAEPVEMAAGVTRTVQPRSLVVLQEVGGRQSW